MLIAFSVGNVWAETTYKLTQVTSVSAGNKYVFVQDNHAMNNTTSSSALQTTTSYSTTGLNGNETYVWTLETATGGFYMKNVSLASDQYLNNASSTNVSFGNKSSIWTFTFDANNFALIQNINNNSRYLGFTNATSYAYKAYSTQNMTYAHEITVYVLEEESTGCDKKVNISAGTTSNGTFDLSKTGEAATCDAAVEVVVTPHPAEHFEVDQVTASNGGSVSGPNGDGKYTVTYAKDYNNSSEINVTFKQKAQYTVTWNVSGDETIKTSVYKDEKPEFPTNPASCDQTSTTFIGWSTAPWNGKIANLDDKTVYTSASAMPEVTGAVTYYAVFAKVAGESGWIETAIADLGASDVFVIVGNNGSTYAMTNNNGTSSAPGASSVTIADSKISGAVADNIKWNISGNATDGYTFYPNENSESWLYCTSANNGVRVGTNDNKTFTVQDGYLYHSATSRYVGIYNSQDWRCYTLTNNNAFPVNIENQTFAFYKYSAGSASDYMTTCCTKYNVAIAAGIENGSVTADIASACEGTEITLTPSAAGSYHFDAWDVYKTGESATKVTVTANKFSMPAYGVTVSATFAHDPCENLAAPTLDGVTKTYNTANIAWNTVTDAEEYAVSVVNHATSASVFAGNVDALSKALADLEPETQYDYTIMAIGDGTVKCADGNGVLEGNFTTTALPTAQLTLIDPSGTHAFSGAKTILTPFNLPTTAATCAKTFVGWDADAECATAPTYAKGAEFTFANTTGVTLYAVYADGGEEDETITPSAVSGTEDPYSFTIDKSGYTLSANKNAGTNAPTWNSTGSDVRVYAKGDVVLTSSKTMTSIVFNLSTQGKNRLAPITASVGSIAAQAEGDETVTWTGSATSVTFTVGDKATYSSDATKAGQLCFSNIDVTVQGEYSNYSTTCVDAPVATPSPTALSNIAAAGTSGTITMTYENVNTANVAVSVWSNEACTEAIEGNWLSATLNSDKNIEYSIAEYNSYASDRSAYIKLTAPETNGATAPDIVKIPVTQVKKDAVFTSLEDLALSDVPANTNVTVSFSNVPIKSIYYYPNNTSENNRKGVVFDIQKAGQDIKIYYNAKVSEEWVAGGKLSGTLTDCPWKIYGGGWQLAPTDWAWSNLTYTAPAAIESLEIRGNATKKTYIDGQAFDHTGLTAWAIYSDTHEEEVTALATWTYDPAKLSEGDTEVTVTATYAEQSDDETVTGLTVNPIPNKTIAEFITAGGTRCYLEGIVGTIENTTYGNFYLTDANNSTIYVYGCLTPEGESKKFADLEVEQGDQIKVIAEAYTNHATKGHEAVNVVFVSKVSAATITIDDINDMVVGDEILLSAIEATITPVAAQSATINYAVTEGTAVTIEEGKIKATAEGEATITASIEAGEGYLAGSTTFTVTVGPAPEPFDGDYFVKVAANSELTAGEYLIVYEGGNVAFNGGLETLDAVSNTVAVTFDHGKIQGTNEVLAATFTIKLAGTIQSKSGYYIGRTGNSNGMNTSEDEAYTNAISIDNNGNAVILASGGAYMRYNSADNQKRFRYFQSSSYTGQKAIQLYKKENAEPVYETVRTDLNEGEYYTMCLDKAVTAVQGGTIWRVVSKSDNTAKPGIILEDVAGTLDAGRPYIFRATADKLEVAYTGAAVSAPLTENNNGLVGSFSQAPITKDVNNYIIYNNMLYLVDSENVYVGANRAYLNMDAVPAYTGAASAPGRRRVVMAVHSEQNATGVDALNATETPVKMIIDGQLYILRGEKLFDATGHLVK